MGRRDRDDRRRSYDRDEEEDDDYERSASSSKRRKKSSRKGDHRRRSSRSPSSDTRRNDAEEGEEENKGRNHRDKESDGGGRRKRGRDSDKDDEKPRHRKRDRKEYTASPIASDASTSSDSMNKDSDKNDDKHHRRKKDRNDKKKRKDDGKKKKKSKDKKDKKKKKKKHKREKSRASKDIDSDDDSGNEQTAAAMKEFERNYALAESLHELLAYHPTVMATDTLPVLLIQLGGGTTLDLRQMTDQHAARGLEKVLACLSPFGVTQENHVWKWNAPGPGNAKRDERILVRIVRTLLNDIGFTMGAVGDFEKKEHEKAEAAANAPVKTSESNTGDESDDANGDIKKNTLAMLQQFQNSQKSKDDSSPSTLPGELGGLCKMILEGETISLEGLPDAKLREALEKLFQRCGLEQCEMEESDSDQDEEDDEGKADNKAASTTIGYGLPESAENQDRVRASLLSVMEACKHAASTPAVPQKRAVKGPMPMPANFVPPEESSDDEGPAPVGVAVKSAFKKPKELVQEEAEMRARQLKGAVTGQEELMATGPNQREEWMLVPGKFDFLSSIKAGNPQRSRNFQSKSKVDHNESGERVMDPKIKAEMDAIMEAHTEARGPTLVEQHRAKKEEERQEKAASGKGKKGDWNWSRDKDLDAGRKVDKNALHQVLGGAVSDLKKKFQGGF